MTETTNHGLNRQAGARADRRLDATRHVEALRVGSDGYVDMDHYNGAINHWIVDHARTGPRRNGTRAATAATAKAP